jgi:hypothetical protein
MNPDKEEALPDEVSVRLSQSGNFSALGDKCHKS